MSQLADPSSVSVPRSVLAELAKLSPIEVERMHALLERNTDGALNSSEQEELRALVRLAEIDQIVGTLLRTPSVP